MHGVYVIRWFGDRKKLVDSKFQDGWMMRGRILQGWRNGSDGFTDGNRGAQCGRGNRQGGGTGGDAEDDGKI